MEFEKTLAPFLDIHNNPYMRVKEWKKAHDGKVIGLLLPDVPEEIIHAFGAFPLPIFGTEKPDTYAHARLPSFTCDLIRGPLEMALDGELDFIDGMVIPYVCDSTRAFSQVWELNFPDLFNFTLWLPKKITGNAPKRFLLQELERMKSQITRFLGKEIKKDDLRQSIEVFNRNRRLLRELREVQRKSSSPLSNTAHMAIIKASMLMPKEEHSRRLEQLLEIMRSHQGRGLEAAGDSPERVFIFGSLCPTIPIYEYFDQAKMVVVDDNLYNGTRYYSEDAETEGDPLEKLVKRHFKKNPISCYHYSKGDWKRYIRQRIEKNDIKGVVFINLKYCELLQFDYPLIKELLQEMEKPVFFAETDFSHGSKAQLQTRLEAFAEMLRG